MDIDRVKRFCEKAIRDEQVKPMPSTDVISSYGKILNFIANADTPNADDLVQVEKIFCAYHEKHKNTKHPITKSDRQEFMQIILQIKLEMEANTEQYASFTVVKFFEMFMDKMDDFWIRNVFTPCGFNKNFRKILGAIKSKAISRKPSGGYGKLSYADART